MSIPLGITFSHPHLEQLNIPIQAALKTALTYNFSHIRLGAYWNRVENQPQHYNFSEIKELLIACEHNKQPVVMTLGVKAPRWPEYYWPDYIAVKDTSNSETQHFLLQFLTRAVQELQVFTCITHWQIENEPLDRSGPQRLTISEDFLDTEVKLVKQLDPRPIIISLWGNDLLARKLLPKANQLGDIVGIDIYYQQFIYQLLNRSFYQGPRQSDEKLTTHLRLHSRPVWITELQAEPWEKDAAAYQAANPASISPDQLRTNILRARLLPVTEILLWGFEYWCWRANQGDERYFEVVKSLIEAQVS